MNKNKELNKEALLTSLYRRIKNRINFFSNKKYQLINELIKKTDEDQLQKAREDILK
jgi:hypothetical protein